ncbi:hypothetical protein M3J09_003002 [Ascochyta lentis]
MTTAFTATKIIGLTGAAWLSGSIASITLISIPAITQSISDAHLPAPHALNLWRNNFTAGFAIAPPTAVVTAASLAFCALVTPVGAQSRGNGKLFWVAAALTVGIVPYTLLFMRGTNERLLLLAKKEELDGEEGREGVELLGRWARLNGGRCLLPLAGAVVAGVAVLA